MKNIDFRPPEIITNQERKEEKKFKTIQGVRFEEGISQEFIDDFFKSYNRELNKYEAEDDRTYIEHRSAGGSALSTIQPLKPYSIISGFKKPEELVKSRERAGPILGFYNFNRNTNQAVLGGDTGGSIEIELDDSVRDEFSEALEDIKSKNNKEVLRVMCEFNEPKINPETGDIVMPTLRKFYLSRPGDIKLTNESFSKIKLKERLMEEYGSKKYFIDQYGWRIEKI